MSRTTPLEPEGVSAVPGPQRMAGGFVALGAATGVSQILGFILLAVAARRLGPADLGAFAFAVSAVAYFAIPANFGVTAYAVRDIAREPERVREIMGEVVLLLGALVLLPYLAVVLLAPVVAPDAASQSVLPVVGLTFVIEAASLAWVLYGTQRFGWVALARVLGSLVNVALVLLLVHGGPEGARTLAWCAVAGVAVTALATLVPVLRSVGRPALAWSWRRSLARFRAGLPFGIAGVMISIYYAIDSVMLGYLRGTDDVGQYAVAYKVPLAVIALAALWASVLFPYASALGLSDPTRLRHQVGEFASLFAVAALPIGLGSALVGTDLMRELFGDQYGPAGTPFVLLMVAATLVVVTINYGTVAQAIGEERHFAVAVTAAAALNLGLNFVVIPLFGMTGAAAATIAAEVLVFALVWLRLRSRLGPMPLQSGRLVRVAGAAAGMAAVMLVLPGEWPALVQISIGGAVYLGAATALRVVSAAELRALRAGLPSRGRHAGQAGGG